jgi:hypothetical protein
MAQDKFPPTDGNPSGKGGGGSKSYCGACGHTECVCKQYKETGVGTVNGGAAGAAEEKKPYTVGGGGKD